MNTFDTDHKNVSIMYIIFLLTQILKSRKEHFQLFNILILHSRSGYNMKDYLQAEMN